MKETRTFHYRRKDTGEQIAIEVEVDLQALADRNGGKAIKSKSGVATLANGAVKIRHVRSPLPQKGGE